MTFRAMKIVVLPSSHPHFKEQSFNFAGSLFNKLAAQNINERCPYDCFILVNFISCFLKFIFRRSVNSVGIVLDCSGEVSDSSPSPDQHLGS